MIAIIAVASAAGSRFENDFSGVGQSGQASSILAQRFPAQTGDAAQVVFHSSGPIRFPGVTAQVDQALAALPAQLGAPAGALFGVGVLAGPTSPAGG